VSKVKAIFLKDLKSYFTSPIAYAVYTVFLGITGFLFFSILSAFSIESIQYMRYPYLMERINLNDMVLYPLFHNMVVTFLLLIPILTMRLMAEEKKSGTVELLFTSPVSSFQIMMGKYLAALVVMCGMLALTFIYPGILAIYGNPDMGPVASSYIGLLLVGASFLAVGLFTSSLTENQIIAAAISFGILLLFWVIGWASHAAGSALGGILRYLSIFEHFRDFARGLIQTKDVVFYLTFAALMLFCTQMIIDSRRWR